MHPAPLAALWLVLPALATAQTWNADSALALARRAGERRARAAGDTALRDYKAQAHGFLFFLGQFGEGLAEPPRLVKADQLELEVYWKAPRLSKQRIVGWRDRAELPTDIQYHRDHLGIVQNNFGTVIRLGEGDEVRDVVHPLVPGAERLYDYALGDTVTLALPQRAVRVVALHVRPKALDRPSLIGTLYLDAATADLVRLTFSFTPAAYVDAQLEDVSIVLDNALWEGRFWLPYRQEIEIRRRATWLDIPARGIIRGRWEIDAYVFNLGLTDAWFGGPEITAVPAAERDVFPWGEPLAAALRDIAEPVRRSDLARVRHDVQAVAGGRALSGLQPRRLGVRSLSELLHATRVEGLAPGAGLVWRVTRLEMRVLASYGLADGRGKGMARVVDASGAEVAVYREVRDVSDVPVIAPLLNSFAAQEFGDDYGDYYQADGGRLGWRRRLGPRTEWEVGVGRERIRSLAVRATPASGTFRGNPALGPARIDFARLVVRRRSGGFALRRDLAAEIALEGGRDAAHRGYLRAAARGQALVPLGGTTVLLRAEGGVAGGDLPAHRAFVLGGRGTLLGDGFRRWGGARAGFAHLEWRLPAPLLALRIGSFARIPAPLTLAPYVAVGRAARAVPGTPWAATPQTRVTAGLGLEWLGVVRLEVGLGMQSRRAHLALDVTRDFWGIL